MVQTRRRLEHACGAAAVITSLITTDCDCSDRRTAPTNDTGTPASGLDATASGGSASPIGSSPIAGSPCSIDRPFPMGAAAPTATPPSPFERFTTCDVVEAIFPDFDRTTQRSTAVGPVRVEALRRWDAGGRSLLAAIYYTGEQAEMPFLCGSCRVTPHLGVVERNGNSLVLVGKPAQPWHPAEEDEAVFDGQAQFDTSEFAIAGETVIPVLVSWSNGMMGAYQNLTLYRLVSNGLVPVFEYRVRWQANGMGTEDDEEVRSTVTVEPHANGPADLMVSTVDVRCKPSEGNPEVRKCAAPRKVGAERWRLEGDAYRRIEGREAPMPGVLRQQWGW